MTAKKRKTGRPKGSRWLGENRQRVSVQLPEDCYLWLSKQSVTQRRPMASILLELVERHRRETLKWPR